MERDFALHLPTGTNGQCQEAGKGAHVLSAQATWNHDYHPQMLALHYVF